MRDLYPVRGLLSSTTPEFRTRLREVSEWLGVDPTDLAAIIAFESGFNPRAVNQVSQATGLIQWIPSTARAMYSLTVAQIASLSAVEQLELVRRYFAGARGRNLDAHGLYMLVWNGSPASQDEVLGVSDAGGHSGLVYSQNKGLDLNRDGQITAGEASTIVRSIVAAAKRQPPVVDDPKAPAPATGSASLSGPPSLLRSYRVRSGDTAFELAKRATKNGSRWRELLSCNPRSRVERLLTDSDLVIPEGWTL
jgi:hypothetical protein